MTKATTAPAAPGLSREHIPTEGAARDARLARAMEFFEYRIHDLVCATKLLEVVKGATLDHLDGPIVEMVRERCPFVGDFHVYVLDKDDSEALSYAIHHVGNLARDMSRDFLASLDGSAQS